MLGFDSRRFNDLGFDRFSVLKDGKRLREVTFQNAGHTFPNSTVLQVTLGMSVNLSQESMALFDRFCFPRLDCSRGDLMSLRRIGRRSYVVESTGKKVMGFKNISFELDQSTSRQCNG